MGNATVLVVEDDPTVSDIVTRYLEREDFTVTAVANGKEALAIALDIRPDCMVLDVMLPGMNGFEVLRQLRLVSPLPVLMLTARGEEEDKINGLERGADDYLVKPASPRELVARVKALIRRSQPAHNEPSRSDAVIKTGELAIDIANRRVTRSGADVTLTNREFDLLAYLTSHPGEVVTRDQLLEVVWGYTFGDASTVTVHVRRLRQKIEQDPSEPHHILTVWGNGYRWSDQTVPLDPPTPAT